jgi:L-ascorbate metabolism protein UlaG (beta-lactamase superfamily)
MSRVAARGMRWEYPAIAGVAPDLLLVTHEHADHNAIDVIGGEPVVLRSTAGRLESPIGRVDLAFLPVGGGPTMGGVLAADIAHRIGARWVVPMHYRTPRIDFLEPADAFLGEIRAVHRPGATACETAALPEGDSPLAVVLDAP